MVDAVDGGGAVGGESCEDEACAGAEVDGHDGRADESTHAGDHGTGAAASDLGTHAQQFSGVHETVGEDLAEWDETPGVVGARIMLTAQEYEADDPGLNRILAAGAKAGIPVNVMSSGKLPLLRELARRNPDTQIVVDHVGLAQPFEPPAPPEPFADLANVLSLAELANVSIKISGACTLSHQPFPYPDIWESLGKVFNAFGFDRCMWGTDWTRAVLLLTYEQGVEAFRVTDQLSDSERSALMGGTLMKIYKWSPDMGG